MTDRVLFIPQSPLPCPTSFTRVRAVEKEEQRARDMEDEAKERERVAKEAEEKRHLAKLYDENFVTENPPFESQTLKPFFLEYDRITSLDRMLERNEMERMEKEGVAKNPAGQNGGLGEKLRAAVEARQKKAARARQREAQQAARRREKRESAGEKFRKGRQKLQVNTTVRRAISFATTSHSPGSSGKRSRSPKRRTMNSPKRGGSGSVPQSKEKEGRIPEENPLDKAKRLRLHLDEARQSDVKRQGGWRVSPRPEMSLKG